MFYLCIYVDGCELFGNIFHYWKYWKYFSLFVFFPHLLELNCVLFGSSLIVVLIFDYNFYILTITFGI